MVYPPPDGTLGYKWRLLGKLLNGPKVGIVDQPFPPFGLEKKKEKKNRTCGA